MAEGALGLEQAIGALVHAVEESRAPAMLIGGVAVIARGVPRHTDDVDGTIAGDAIELTALLQVLDRHGIRPRIDDAIGFARRYQILLLEHVPSGTEIELSLAWLPFEHEALARAEVLKLGGIAARVASVDDLIIYKTVAWRERDRADVERLIESYAERIDFGRGEDHVGQFGEALDAPERLREFIGLKRRVLARISETDGG